MPPGHCCNDGSGRRAVAGGAARAGLAHVAVDVLGSLAHRSRRAVAGEAARAGLAHVVVDVLGRRAYCGSTTVVNAVLMQWQPTTTSLKSGSRGC